MFFLSVKSGATGKAGKELGAVSAELVMIHTGGAAKQPVAICARKSRFLEAVRLKVSSTGSAFLTLARVVGRVVRVKSPIAIMAKISRVQETLEGGDAVEMVACLE